MTAPLLSVRDLVTVFPGDKGPIRAVDEATFELAPGETVGLVGESGCGKSMTALSILRLLPSAGRILGGSIVFQGRNLLDLSPDDMRRVRGARISMIFQDPMTSLNPVFRIGDQIGESLILHQGMTRAAARRRTIELLEQVRLPDPTLRVDDFPHQFSGGQRQRIMIAMALACRPALLIADEPTTALDVTIQAQILALLGDLRRETGMAMLLITHDLAVVSEVADRIMLMYAGQIVESGVVSQILEHPRHPYTKGLLRSIPEFSGANAAGKERLLTIRGVVPDLGALPSGCRFSDRCDYHQPHCHLREPPPEAVAERHGVRCWEWRSV